METVWRKKFTSKVTVKNVFDQRDSRDNAINGTAALCGPFTWRRPMILDFSPWIHYVSMNIHRLIRLPSVYNPLSSAVLQEKDLISKPLQIWPERSKWTRTLWISTWNWTCVMQPTSALYITLWQSMENGKIWFVSWKCWKKAKSPLELVKKISYAIRSSSLKWAAEAF